MFEPPERVDDSRRRLETKPQTAFVRLVQEILYKAAVPHLVVKFSPEQSPGQVCAVIMVPRMTKARIWLRRAGFQQSPESKAVLFHPESGTSIELVERQCEGEG